MELRVPLTLLGKNKLWGIKNIVIEPKPYFALFPLFSVLHTHSLYLSSIKAVGYSFTSSEEQQKEWSEVASWEGKWS